MLDIMKWISQDWPHVFFTLLFLVAVGEAFTPLVKITHHHTHHHTRRPHDSTAQEDDKDPAK